jgi:hypothetical protein
MSLPRAVRGGGRAHHPSFARRERHGAVIAAGLGVVAAVAVIALTAQAGLWFVPFVAGLLAGLAGRLAGWRLWATLPAVLLIAAAGWAAPLWWSTLRGWPVGATARVLAALAGLPPHAVVAVAVTLLIAIVQAAVGLWLGWVLAALAPGAR